MCMCHYACVSVCVFVGVCEGVCGLFLSVRVCGCICVSAGVEGYPFLSEKFGGISVFAC